MNFGMKLTDLRKEHGLSQLEMAEKLNVSRQSISKWELGTAVPSVDNLKSLRALFGVSIDYLLDDTMEVPDKGGEPEPAIPAPEAPMPQTGKTHIKLILAGLAVLIVTVVITAVVTIFLVQKDGHDENGVIPIEELDRSDGNVHDDYTTFTFDIK